MTMTNLSEKKTIKQISEDLGISRQAVYKKIKKEPLATNLQPFTTTVDNVVYIDMEGIGFIEAAFEKDTTPSVSTPVDTELTDRLIDSLQAQIENLTEQNKDAREQLNKEREYNRIQTDRLNELTNKLTILLEQSQQLQQNNQVLLAAQSIDTPDSEEKKKGFFKRIFSKENKQN